jgi:hypothetical protein
MEDAMTENVTTTTKTTTTVELTYQMSLGPRLDELEAFTRAVRDAGLGDQARITLTLNSNVGRSTATFSAVREERK